MIRASSYNPVPFHGSKDDWYDNRKTFHGVHASIYAPKGDTLPCFFTASHDDITIPDPYFIIESVVGTVSMPLSGTYVAQFPFPWSAMEWNKQTVVWNKITPLVQNVNCVAEPHLNPNTGVYEGMKFRFESGGVTYYACKKMTFLGTVVYDYLPFTEQDLMGLTGFYLCSASGSTLIQYNLVCEVIFGRGGIGNPYMLPATVELISCEDESVVDISSEIAIYAENIPARYASENMYYTMYMPETTLLTVGTGLSNYIRITIDNEILYSEPFVWADVSGMIQCTYRHVVPIVSANEYFPFEYGGIECSMKMYINATIMMPELVYEESIRTINGRTFTDGQVSRKRHRFSVLKCTEYFADALRMMWMCAIRQFKAGDDVMDAEYVSPVEVSWDSDNHLCRADVEFITDTILQTDGETYLNVHPQQGRSFNSSYNESYR